jgi:hypothetical protein
MAKRGDGVSGDYGGVVRVRSSRAASRESGVVLKRVRGDGMRCKGARSG